MNKKLLILGCGDQGIVSANTAFLNNKWEDICFLDDNKFNEYKSYKGFNILGKISDLDKFVNEWNNFFISVGDNSLRKKMYEKIDINKRNIINIIHPSVEFSINSIIGKGNIILANSVISNNVKIGNCNIINNLASIDHDCVLEDFIHISPGVNIAGNVLIKSETWIGIGSNIINDIKIGEKVIIGAGSLVIRDIKDKEKVFGVPVRKK